MLLYNKSNTGRGSVYMYEIVLVVVIIIIIIIIKSE